MKETHRSNSAPSSRGDVHFRDVAEAVANLPLTPMLAIANNRPPITKDSTPAEVRDMLVVLRSYLTGWLIPALEMRINPFAGAASFRRPGVGIRVKGGSVEDLMTAIAMVRGQEG
jgi:hypothetical protein